MSPGNPFILGQKVKGQGHVAQKNVCVAHTGSRAVMRSDLCSFRHYINCLFVYLITFFTFSLFTSLLIFFLTYLLLPE